MSKQNEYVLSYLVVAFAFAIVLVSLFSLISTLIVWYDASRMPVAIAFMASPFVAWAAYGRYLMYYYWIDEEE